MTSVQREDELFALITIQVDARGDERLLRRVYATLAANCSRAVFRSGEGVFSVGFLTRDPREGPEAAERMRRAVEREKSLARLEFTTRHLGPGPAKRN